MTERMTSEQYRQYLKTGKEPDYTPTVRATNVEQSSSNGATGSDESKEVCQAVSIRVHCYRNRLADLDNICSKWATDSLVEAGIIEDDSPEFVKEVTFSETKCAHRHQERTEITVVQSSTIKD